MHRLLFILQKGRVPPKTTVAPEENALITENYVYLVPDDNKIKLYRGGSYEEFTLEQAQEKLKEVYDSIDYIVYENRPVKTYLSNFDYLIDEFKSYTNPEVGVIYSDFYRQGGCLNKHEFLKNFTPENFIQNIPPVVVVNKKYLQGLPMSIDQQVATYLIGSCPVLHIPEAMYILE